MKTQFLSVALLAVALTFGTLFTQTARADQPHMENALSALENAKAELQQAEHDKGGHRANAIRLIDRAIEQVKLGIDAGA